MPVVCGVWTSDGCARLNGADVSPADSVVSDCRSVRALRVREMPVRELVRGSILPPDKYASHGHSGNSVPSQFDDGTIEKDFLPSKSWRGRVIAPLTSGGNMADSGTLHDAFIDELRDTYDAEKQLTKALPKMVKASSSP